MRQEQPRNKHLRVSESIIYLMHRSQIEMAGVHDRIQEKYKALIRDAKFREPMKYHIEYAGFLRNNISMM
jgi:hypothetical protein